MTVRFSTKKSAVSVRTACSKRGLARGRGKYTEEQNAFLRSNSSLSRKKLTELFNARFGTSVNVHTLSAYCCSKGWYTGKRATGAGSHKVYTDEHIRFLEENCWMPRKKLAAAFNARFGMDKSVTEIASACVCRGFVKNHTGYTAEQAGFVREYYLMPIQDRTRAFNERFGTKVSYSAIVYICRKFDISFTDAQRAFMDANKGKGRKEIAKMYYAPEVH